MRSTRTGIYFFSISNTATWPTSELRRLNPFVASPCKEFSFSLKNNASAACHLTEANRNSWSARSGNRAISAMVEAVARFLKYTLFAGRNFSQSAAILLIRKFVSLSMTPALDNPGNRRRGSHEISICIDEITACLRQQEHHSAKIDRRGNVRIDLRIKETVDQFLIDFLAMLQREMLRRNLLWQEFGIGSVLLYSERRKNSLERLWLPRHQPKL